MSDLINSKVGLFCDGCPDLYPNELEQSRSILPELPPHMCRVYKKQVFHNGHHPSIERLPECIAAEQAMRQSMRRTA